MLKKLGLLSVVAASAMAMHTAQININNVDLEVGVALDVGQFNDNVAPNTTFVGFTYLKGDTDNSDVADPGSYVEANFLIQREINDSGFFAGLGVKLNYVDTNSGLDFMAIPLTLKGGYALEAGVPLYFSASVDYAPQVLCLQDAKNYFGFRLEAEAEVIQNASIYAGYRTLQTKFDVPNSEFVSYNDSLYVGFKFKF